MEKLIYTFWKPGAEITALRDKLVNELGPRLAEAAGVHGVQFNICDEVFANRKDLPPLYRTQPQLQGIINLWVDTAFFRPPLEKMIGEYVAGFHGYAVVESRPIVHEPFALKSGQRSPCFSQVVLLEKPKQMARAEWYKIWLESHTRVAIDTQSTFGYAQNVVLRSLTEGAPEYHGIIEELFPEAAFNDQNVFYDAVGDDAKLAANFKSMMDSCARFIDNSQIDIIYTSQYVIR